MKNIFIFTIILLGLGCSERITINPPFKENIVIQTTLTNKEEYLEVYIDKTRPLSVEPFDPTKASTIGGGDKKERPPSKAYTIRLYQGKDENTKTLLTDLSGSTVEFEENYITDPFSKNKEVVIYYKSTKKIKATTKQYYWLEIEYDGKTYVTDKQWMQSELKVTGRELYEGKNPLVIFEDNPNERNFYTLEYRRKKSNKEYEDYMRYEGSSSDVLTDGKKNASMIFTEITVDDPKETFELTISCSNYSTYRFLSIIRKQDRENGVEAQVNSSPLFSTPPPNPNGNIYEKDSKEPILGNFNVKSVYSEEVTGEQLGFKK